MDGGNNIHKITERLLLVCGLNKTFFLCQWPPQFVVAKGNNIFEVAERLFNVGYWLQQIMVSLTANSISVTSQMLCPLAITNCGGH